MRFKDNDMKPYACTIIVVLAVITIGCTASKKTAANQHHFLAAPNPTAMPSESSEDDEFDLLDEDLEKQLEEQKVKVSDPLKPVNRMMYHINDRLYFWVLKPCARAYKKALPKPARISIRNFFHNLTTPVRFVSCHLQGKHKAAGTELHRFAYNTTAGVLGFGDPAKDKLGLEPADEDLGQTLGKWGLGNGVYIVLPLFGPSTVRDTVGLVGGQFLNPVRYVESTEVSIAISAGQITNENSLRLGEYKAFKDAALDPYIAMRQAYIQYRKKRVQE
jgi:phospholipid-binding lipoprotein MlaA